jgi:1,2-diacylglycerol 3-beta-galactosyltransferase
MLDCQWLVMVAVFGRSAKQGGFENFYNWLMQKGAYRAASLLTYGAPLGAALLRPIVERGFRNFFKERRPPVVVSFVPHFNSHLSVSLAGICPLVTVATDMDSTVAHRWVDAWRVQRRARHYLVAGTARLQARARSLGWTPPNLLCSSGMVVNPAYYASPSELSRPCSSVGLVLFGGFAPERTLRIVECALKVHTELRLVVICGLNSQLMHKLTTLDARVTALGFIPPEQVHANMINASFLLGKPGPGTISEASVCGTPLVVERKNVMVHERGSLQWINDNCAGIVIDNLEALPPDLNERLAPCRLALAQMKTKNRAVFEVAELVGSLLRPI